MLQSYNIACLVCPVKRLQQNSVGYLLFGEIMHVFVERIEIFWRRYYFLAEVGEGERVRDLILPAAPFDLL